MKMQDVRMMAKGMGINSFGKTKEELIREIQRNEGNVDCYGSAIGDCDQIDCCFRSSCIEENKPRGKTKKAH